MNRDFPIVRDDHQIKSQHFGCDELLDELLQHEPDHEQANDTEKHNFNQP